MTYRELIKDIAKRKKLSYSEVESVINELLLVISEKISKGIPVRLKKFATLKTVDRAERSWYIPSTGETKKFPKLKTVKVLLSKDLRKRINML